MMSLCTCTLHLNSHRLALSSLNFASPFFYTTLARKMDLRDADYSEGNEGLKNMVSDLGALLSAHGKREREVWLKLHKILPKLVAYLSVAINPNTTTNTILIEMEKAMGSLSLGHLEVEGLLRQIMTILEQQIIEENADASQAITLFKNLMMLVADELDMLPIRDSKHETMISEYIFFEDKVDRMVKASMELSQPNAPYAVVSIVGAQSSGKSYLLNQLFGTDFPELNRLKRGWSRTTKGILISRCIRPSFLILDVEGFDGVERQQLQDTSFENKAALFTLAISDLMMVNIAEQDINREDGGGAKLFRAIFQERTELPRGLTHIIIVVRRYDGEVPLDKLEGQVVDRMEELWEAVHKKKRDVKFRDYIEVKVVALPDKNSEDFQEKVKELRKVLCNCASELSAKVPASSFSHSSKLLWEQIKENKRLDLPSHQAIVATMYCNRISEEAINSLYSQKEYELIKAEKYPRDFKKMSDTLLDNIITMYDKETKMYMDDVRDKERGRLVNEIKKILTVHSKKLIMKIREKRSEQSQNEFGMILNSVEENVEPSHYDTFIDQWRKEFADMCEDLKEFDKDFFHEQGRDLERELHIYVRSQLLRIVEERARKQVEFAQQRNDKNVEEMMKKLDETVRSRQTMDEEMKREKEKQEEENRKATQELERQHQRTVAIKDNEISRLRHELEEAHSRPKFSLSGLIDKISDCSLM
ncbi:hypothetical protein BS78_05G219700 [Paspalum vaginatum]|nr:hypothetical protein BS78_05G219700 [Paspalum vaginatum]